MVVCFIALAITAAMGSPRCESAPQSMSNNLSYGAYLVDVDGVAIGVVRADERGRRQRPRV